MGRVYAVASGKGGVGKTTTTANLGTALARAGHETVVVDADLGMANLAAALGVNDDGPTLHDVLAGEATVEDAIREAPDRPAVVPGSRDIGDFAGARTEGLAGVLGTLADEYEHVLVDTGAGLSTDSLEPLRAADEVVLVSTPDAVALGDTAKTAAVTSRLGTPLRGYVVVRARGESVQRARETLDGEVLGTIPEDPAVTDALAAGLPLAEYAPRSPATGAYRRLAVTLTGVSVPDPEAGPGAGADEATTTADPTDGSGPEADEASDAPDRRPATADREGDAGPDAATDADADAGDGEVAIDAGGVPEPGEDPDDETGVLVEPAEGDRSGGGRGDDAGTAVEEEGDSDDDTVAEDAADDGGTGSDGDDAATPGEEAVPADDGDDAATPGEGAVPDDAAKAPGDADDAETAEVSGTTADQDDVTVGADGVTDVEGEDEQDGRESDDGSAQPEAADADEEGVDGTASGGVDGDTDDGDADSDDGDDGDADSDDGDDGDAEKKGFFRRLFG